MNQTKPGSVFGIKPASILAAIAIAALLAVAPVAGAQSPTDAQYDSSTELVEEATGGGGGGGEKADDGDGGGTLAFTGNDAMILGAVALSLVAAGFGLRRFALSR